MGSRSRLLLAALVACSAAAGAYTGTAPGPTAFPVPATPSRPPVALTVAPVSAAATPDPPTAPGPLGRGTQGWQLSHPGPAAAIEGFADRASVVAGQPARLFVSTTAPGFTVTAFRFGDYTDSDARAVWTSPHQVGTRQQAAAVREPTHTVVAPWTPSLTVSTDGWLPGDYLLRLDADGGAGQRFVPLTVRTPSNAGRVVIVNAVTTWQAYNLWGGYDLYRGPDGRRSSRSRAVSFDRPYSAQMQGAGQFLQFELGALRVAERAGVPLGYATDLDLHADPHLLDGARAVVTMGHDEYWSTVMRAAAFSARDRGVNLAFLGGNEAYRHIRLAATALGPDRLEINYKSAQEDPVHLTDPAEATQDWRQSPDPRPESALVGGYYSCFPGRADLVVADASSWLLAGLVHDGQHLPGVVGIEYAHVDLGVPTPRPIQVLFRSPVVCGATKRADHADATYYSVPSGAGVFSSGTQDWVCGMAPECPAGAGEHEDVARTLDAIFTRLVRTFAVGPAGRTHPARDNLAWLHVVSSGHVVAAADAD